MKFTYPKRVVCLTEETTETLYALGLDEYIVGITKYTVRPKEAKLTKKIVARYLDAKIDDIIELKPDIVFAWSDLQANIVADLVKQGIEVYCFNHRSIEGILSMVVKLGSLFGKNKEAEAYANKLSQKIEHTKQLGLSRKLKPKVYFEEWYDPLITGICWVSQIIELCGGVDLFEENRHFQDAKRRILPDSNMVIERNPDIILASWCGMKFRKNKMIARTGWEAITAIQNDEIYHIESEIILQPGPAAITDGIDIIMEIFDKWETKQKL